MNKRQTGTFYEEMAAKYLEQQGYQILERNFYSRYGEIDLIAMEEGTLVFVEVKYRSSLKIQRPEEAVDWKKQKKICKTADYYRLKRQILEDVPCRFDILAMTPDEKRLYRNAFSYFSW